MRDIDKAAPLKFCWVASCSAPVRSCKVIKITGSSKSDRETAPAVCSPLFSPIRGPTKVIALSSTERSGLPGPANKGKYLAVFGYQPVQTGTRKNRQAAFEKLLSSMVKPDKTIIAIQQDQWKRQHIHHLSQRKWGSCSAVIWRLVMLAIQIYPSFQF